MKKAALAAFVFMFVALYAGIVYAETSFAILPMEKGSNISEADRDSAENALYRHLIKSGKYKIVERTRLKKLIDERKLQMSGIADQSKAVEIGKILGVEKLLAGKIYYESSNTYNVTINVIDVATGQMEFTDQVSESNYSADDHGRWAASLIINKYPLTGKVIGKSGDMIVVDLGKNHGLSEGKRLFVARENMLRGDSGQVLFKEIKRIGTLEVVKAGSGRSVAGIKEMENPGDSPRKDDLVSPEPIPRKEPVISHSPLLSHVQKGKLILEDDMRKQKYLSTSNNRVEDYSGGKLHMDGTHKKAGHVYCYYPTPYDNLENFIIEGEVEFQKVETKYNRVSVVVREEGSYTSASNYSFFWNDEGKYAVYRYLVGNFFTIVNLQSSPVINRGNSKNTFRIVAYGPKFDFYLNNRFVVGLEDEFLESGKVGFWVNDGSYSTFDNVKIWEAVKK